ncbi:serine carboxypeptidase-like [Gastrolobium bilobum]|uniref:serine carboxypeptidase-like n=1 Tax=Gastrolobium bilobum TaxID=150636 RepID=UPI002AB312B3|nr:serine carboxypeptidase-like [Gastrolobium bilobum]
MASSPTLAKICVSILSLFIISVSSGLTSDRDLYTPNPHAEKLIRGLNLFPKDPVNIRLADPVAFVPGNIVEKKFSFFCASGPSVEDLGHHAGYYSLPRSKAARMFYFFFESRNCTNDPVVIWLSGGPGCSSELALFYENGPFKIANNLSLIWNDYGWDKVSNIIFVDQPIGTGFSYTSDSADIPHDEMGVSNDLYDFLQAFFKQHPKFVKNDFYITGESYAGHYIPALASRVHKGNKEKQGICINLKGFAIGNGLTNPGIQYQAYTDFALDTGLISKAEYENITKLIPGCEKATTTCNTEGGETCLSALSVCENIYDDILTIAGNINVYDIRKKCVGELCYNLTSVEKLLNKKSVRDALGVGDLQFVSCSTTVYNAMLQDKMRNLELGIPALLEDGIRMLAYAGEYDFICNWIGNSRWVHAMEWSGQKEFGASHKVQFMVDGAKAGLLKSFGPLSFLKVYGAGHILPMDQPKAALHMVKSWMDGKLT